MVDFNPWNEWLHRYVDEQGRVDYATWKQQAEVPLQQWLQDLAREVEGQAAGIISTGDRPASDAQLAVWLNLYNALTISQVLQQYPIKSIQPKILGIPNWLAFWRFFTRPIYGLNGQKLSLNAIEHGILRTQFTEPRIHFALVCASLGCPLLRREAYFPEQVQAQLAADANRFINNPEKVKYDSQANVLYCSKIFKWYKKDFLQVATSIPTYIQIHLSDQFSLNDQTPIQYLPYSWQLNQQDEVCN